MLFAVHMILNCGIFPAIKPSLDINIHHSSKQSGRILGGRMIVSVQSVEANTALRVSFKNISVLLYVLEPERIYGVFSRVLTCLNARTHTHTSHHPAFPCAAVF